MLWTFLKDVDIRSPQDLLKNHFNVEFITLDVVVTLYDII